MVDFRNSDVEGPTSTTARGVWTTRPSTALPASPPLTPVTNPAIAGGTTGARNKRLATRIRRIGRVALIGGLVLASVFAVLIFAYRWIAPPTTTLMLAQRIMGTRIDRAWRPFEQISPHLARAVVMSEDAGFCGHRGVDFAELERVYERGLEGGSRGGGSTIAMQVTKNLFLWPSKSYIRKAVEIPLTLVADRWWGKRRMLEIYLNIAEWGPGVFGAEAAARTYFDKPASELTEGEAALLAVALPNPIARNAADPTAQQRRMAGVVQARMRQGANNVRCLTRVRR